MDQINFEFCNVKHKLWAIYPFQEFMRKCNMFQGMFNSCDEVVLKNINKKKTQQLFFEKLTENKESFYLKMKKQNEAIKSSGFLL